MHTPIYHKFIVSLPNTRSINNCWDLLKSSQVSRLSHSSTKSATSTNSNNINNNEERQQTAQVNCLLINILEDPPENVGNSLPFSTGKRTTGVRPDLVYPVYQHNTTQHSERSPESRCRCKSCLPATNQQTSKVKCCCPQSSCLAQVAK